MLFTLDTVYILTTAKKGNITCIGCAIQLGLTIF